jgi:hypothetical protein
MVRAYILTEHERTVLQRYIETGEKLNGYAVLTHLLRKALPQVEKDLELVKRALEGQ